MADTEMKAVKEFFLALELATVIGASESSIKRWIDEGRHRGADTWRASSNTGQCRRGFVAQSGA